MYWVKGTRKSTLLLVCHRNFRVLKYLKVLLGTYKVLDQVPCWKASSKWVLEGTDQVPNRVLLFSNFGYSVAKLAVCWWSKLTSGFFSFLFLSKQFVIFFRFYFILFFQFWKVKQVKFRDLTGRELVGSPSDHFKVVLPQSTIEISMSSTSK